MEWGIWGNQIAFLPNDLVPFPPFRARPFHGEREREKERERERDIAAGAVCLPGRVSEWGSCWMQNWLITGVARYKHWAMLNNRCEDGSPRVVKAQEKCRWRLQTRLCWLSMHSCCPASDRNRHHLRWAVARFGQFWCPAARKEIEGKSNAKVGRQTGRSCKIYLRGFYLQEKISPLGKKLWELGGQHAACQGVRSLKGFFLNPVKSTEGERASGEIER
jgi:hypothetical protein